MQLRPTETLRVILVLLACIVPCSPRAQEQNPFDSPPAESENPFAETTPAAPPAANNENPFAETAPSEENPFDAPSDEPSANPFQETAPPSGNPFDQPAPSQAPGTTSGSPFDQPGSSAANPFEAPSGPSDGPFDSVAQPRPGQPTATLAARPAAVTLGKDIKGLYVLSTGKGLQNIEQINALVADIEAAGFNRVYVEVRNPFGVAYVSDLEAPLPFVRAGFTDPFGELRNRLSPTIELIAVVTLLPVYNATVGPRPPDSNPAGRNPGFVNITPNGRTVAPDNRIYLDPGNPEVDAYLENLLREIEQKISPDGYLLRGVRYPGTDWGYSEAAVLAFRTAVGGKGFPPPNDPVWSAWRRHQLTKLLRSLHASVTGRRPNASFAVEIETDGPPPASWDAWTSSPTYAEHMQDWAEWTREGVVNEIVFQVHERMTPQGNVLEDWVAFVNNNVVGAQPIISLAGGMNFQLGFTIQYKAVRSRGVGTILHHYTEPLRSNSRGFYASLPNIIFNGNPGNAIPGRPMQGTPESREFAMMSSPPAEYIPMTPTPISQTGALGDTPLVFNTPTPEPTSTPVPTFVPENIVRRIYLTSGREVDATILEITPHEVKLKPENSAPMVIPRSVIDRIEPPIE